MLWSALTHPSILYLTNSLSVSSTSALACWLLSCLGPGWVSSCFADKLLSKCLIWKFLPSCPILPHLCPPQVLDVVPFSYCVSRENETAKPYLPKCRQLPSFCLLVALYEEQNLLCRWRNWGTGSEKPKVSWGQWQREATQPGSHSSALPAWHPSTTSQPFSLPFVHDSWMTEFKLRQG